MKTLTLRVPGMVLGGLLVASTAMADTPSLSGPHGHGVQVSGKVTMLRVQQKGIEVMVNGDKIDAEVMVQVDGKPDTVYVLPYHEADPVKAQMIDTLRTAYVNDKPVTIEHIIAPGKKMATINWVQFGELTAK